MKHVKKPNLPENKVKVVFCSELINKKIEYALNNLNIMPVKLYTDSNSADEVTTHPDMLCFHLGGSKWIFREDIYNINKKELDKLNLDIILCGISQRHEYPHNIGLNAAYAGNCLFCLEKYTNENILSIQTNIINVKQGYAKCSVCIIDENSIVTADKSICRKAIGNGMDVLLIKEGGILLNGYNYGFIGGTAGLINKNKIVFTGIVNEGIIKFCNGKNVEVVCLSESPLYDYGGILPVYEE